MLQTLDWVMRASLADLMRRYFGEQAGEKVEAMSKEELAKLNEAVIVAFQEMYPEEGNW